MNTNDYTIRLERTEDYREIENLVREAFWNNGMVCPWYRQNALLFIKRQLHAEKYAAFPSAEGRPLARVHHELYMWGSVRPRETETKPEIFEIDKKAGLYFSGIVGILIVTNSHL